MSHHEALDREHREVRRNQVKYQVAGSTARQGWGRLGSRLCQPGQMWEQCPKYPPSWVKQPGKEPQSHTHGAGK